MKCVMAETVPQRLAGCVAKRRWECGGSRCLAQNGQHHRRTTCILPLDLFMSRHCVAATLAGARPAFTALSDGLQRLTLRADNTVSLLGAGFNISVRSLMVADVVRTLLLLPYCCAGPGR